MPPACPSACPCSCAFSVPPFSWPRFALMCQSVHPPATFWRSRLPPSLRPPPTLPFHSPCSLAGACALGLCVPGLGMPCQVGRGPNPRTQRVPKQCGATIVWPTAQARPAGAVRLSGQGGRAHALVGKPLRRTEDERSFLYWDSKMLFSPVLTFQCLEWPQHIFWVFVLPVPAFEVDFHRVTTSQKTEKGERGRNVATPGVFLQEGPGASGKDEGGQGTASSKPRAAQRGHRILKCFPFLNWLEPFCTKGRVPLLRQDLSVCPSFLKCFVLHDPQVE